MSDASSFPPKPLMSALRARNLSRSYKAFAEHLQAAGFDDEATRMERSAQWWMQYATALAQIPPGKIDEGW